MGTFHDLFDNLDPDSNVRGRQFERIVKWWLLHDPVYKGQVKRVWLWDEWPGRWGADAGIDLVAKTFDGDLWAIQAKAYSPQYNIKKSDVDSFLSEAGRPQFSYRLLVATTNRISKKAARTLEEQEKPSGSKLASDLGKAQLIWPESPDDLRAPPPIPKDPYPHNQEAIANVVAGFDRADRGQLVMACGTGKTLVGLWVTERLEARRTLVLLPSLSLLAQTLREWTANTRRPFAFLPVCSDETVRGEDHLVSHTAELGMPVTTDPAAITSFLRKRGPSVVFSTYQSSPKISEAFEAGRVPAFDLVIADEAHRTVGRVSRDFATVLDSEAIRGKRRLFMTATPRIFTGRVQQVAKEQEYEVASMDDETRFGQVFHRLTFGEAIHRDLLANYQVLIIGIDDPTYRHYVEHGTFVTRDGKEITDARTLAAHITLAKAIHDHNLRRTISFHRTIRRAKHFASEFPRVVEWMPEDAQPDGDLVCDFVSGEMTSSERDLRLDRLRFLDEDERGLLSNARCLGEGVDVPTLDGVAFIDPKGSQTDIVQAVGRAIRRSGDKKIGSIVLPVYIGASDDPEKELSKSAFQPVWAVLKALRDHDEQLAEELDSLRRQLGRVGGRVRLPGKVHTDLPTSVSEDFARAFELRIVEQSTATWDFWYGLLEAFEEREGHTVVPSNHVEADYKLGSWVNSQRASYRSGQLDPGRVRRLESLAKWWWNPQPQMWERGFTMLEVYEDREGHTVVPSNHVEAGYKLGSWVNRQRVSYRRDSLDPERVKRLESLAKWSWNPLPELWESAFALLEDYSQREGTSRVPQAHTVNGFGLGAWVTSQRADYQTGSLPDEFVARLEALPKWSWDPNADEWWEALALLKRFVEREEHCRVPRGPYEEDGIRIGDWAVTQRVSYKKQRLAADQIEALDAIHCWSWDPKDQAWKDAFGLLEQYLAHEGDALVPRSHKEDSFGLGSWVSSQRSLYQRGKLDAKRAELLGALPGWSWDPVSDLWEKGYEALKTYVEREGNAKVGAHHVEKNGYPLGSWIDHQRGSMKKGRLSQDRARRLKELGLDLRGRSGAWDRNLQVLQQYVEDHGHARVPSEHAEGEVKLGRWVVKQRAAKKRGKLSAERIEQLNALPGWTWSASTNGD